MANRVLAAFLAALLPLALFGQTVNFSLKTNHSSYVLGEEVSVNLRLVNRGATPIVVSDYGAFKGNSLAIELADQSGRRILPIREGDMFDDISLERDEGEAFSLNLSEWYSLGVARYRIRAVLVCNGLRYDSPWVLFDVVPGIELARISHYVSVSPAQERTIRLVYWSREGRELAFLRADDAPGGHILRTLFLGDVMRVKKPSIERSGPGAFYVYRQATRDVLARTEIKSDGEGIRIVEVKRAVESVSSPMIDSLREAVERKKNEKKRK